MPLFPSYFYLHLTSYFFLPSHHSFLSFPFLPFPPYPFCLPSYLSHPILLIFPSLPHRYNTFFVFVTEITTFMVVIEGNSRPQNQAIALAVEDAVLLEYQQQSAKQGTTKPPLQYILSASAKHDCILN